MRYRIIVSVATCLLLALPAAADFCDDIDDVTSAWAEIADALEETAGEDVGDLDLPRLERDVNRLLPATESLGEALVDLGDADEEELGDLLLDTTDDLRDVDGDDFSAYLVDRIDDIVDTLDEIVDYCDLVSD